MKRTGIIVLAVLLLLTGCRKSPVPDNDEHSYGRLTGVFRGTLFELPGECSIVTTDYDPDTGVFRCVAQILNDDRVSSYARFELTEDAVLSENPIELSEGSRLENAFYSGNTLYIMENGDSLRRIDLTTGEADEGVALKPLFLFSDGEDDSVQDFTVGADGNLFIRSNREILVLSPTYERLCSIQTESMKGMAADGEGRVWIWGYLDQRLAMAEVNPGYDRLEAPVTLPVDTRGIFFAPGHDLYVMTDNGIDGYDFDTNGRLPVEGTPIVNFINSDIDSYATSIEELFSSDLFLAVKSVENTRIQCPILYRHTEDIDLSGARTVRVALSLQDRYADTIRMKAVEFNREHSDIRIVIDDYTTDMNAEGEALYAKENRLALDITTRIYKPDLVICMPDGPVYGIGANKGYFRDLTPYAEQEGILNDDNIFGCVKRTYTDGDGRLFAVTDWFNIYDNSTLFSTSAMLGAFAEKGSWTLAEFLDYAEILPDNVVLMEELTRETASHFLFGRNEYASFMDFENGTCSFDDGTFARYLDFLASLPTEQEYRMHSPYNFAILDPADKFPYYRDGKVALASQTLFQLETFIELETVFGTKDVVLIGRPTNTGYGTAITGRRVFAITARDDEQAEAAWTVLEALMPSAEEEYDNVGFPALLSVFDAEMDRLMQRKYYVDYGRTGFHSTPKDETWIDGINTKPGIETCFTEEDAAHFYDLFENKLGVPYSPAVSEDITAIVEEEISVFLAGVGSAEDCAAKIQSRVSIWLAEHK